MNLLCGSLFTIFSFSYLYFLQAELIGRAQHILSGGTTTYAPFMGAAVLTCVALLLSAGIQKLLKLPVRFIALAFFPSMGLLGWLTDITPVMTENGLSLGLSNYWVFLIMLAVWGALVFVIKQFPDIKSQYIPFISLRSRPAQRSSRCLRLRCRPWPPRGLHGLSACTRPMLRACRRR